MTSYSNTITLEKTGYNRVKLFEFNIANGVESAVLTLTVTNHGDPYPRYFRVYVNNTLVYNTTVDPSGLQVTLDITSYVKQGDNVIEVVLTTYVGYWTVTGELQIQESSITTTSITRGEESKGKDYEKLIVFTLGMSIVLAIAYGIYKAK